MDVAREVTRKFKLDLLLLIPAHRPPHKARQPIADAYHRYAMAVLASLTDGKLLVSTVELEEPDKPYTFETIERVRKAYGVGVELFFVMGADSFLEVDTWREPVKVLDGANWIVVTRPGHEITTSHLPACLQSRVMDLRGGGEPAFEQVESDRAIYLADYVNLNISSTQIREMVADGQSITGLVPQRVEEYVVKYGLYRRK